MGNAYTSNATLPKPYYTGILIEQVEDLTTAFNDAMDKLETSLAGVQTAADVGVNASVVNTGGKRLVMLQMLSAGCIATIVGQAVGIPFTLLFQSVGSIGMADVGGFKLASAFNATLDDTITLVWDGTSFYEIGRSAN